MKIAKIMEMRDVNQMETQRALRTHGRRWPWVVALLIGITALTGAVVRNRGLMQREPKGESGQPGIRLVEQPSTQYRDQVASGRSPTGNGVVRADHPSSGTD